MPVFDRFTVVLHIFRCNARTKEARLQVALAELPLLRWEQDPGRGKRTPPRPSLETPSPTHPTHTRDDPQQTLSRDPATGTLSRDPPHPQGPSLGTSLPAPTGTLSREPSWDFL